MNKIYDEKLYKINLLNLKLYKNKIKEYII